jgi:hypothetical protein
LVKKEITAHIKPATDADAQAWFDKNQNRVRGRTFEQVKSGIVNFLNNDAGTKARTAYLNKLKAKTKVRVLIGPPRVEVKIAADDPSKGPASAPVQIVEFSDFQ